MADLSLQDALNMFQTGVKQFGLTKALTEANESVQSIKSGIMKDSEQRVALANLAQGLTLRMQGLGASIPDIQQASKSVLGDQPATAQQAILQGSLTGNDELTQAGVESERLGRTGRLEELRAQEGIRERADVRRTEAQEASQSRLFAQQERLQSERLAQQEANNALKQEQKKPTPEEFKTAGFANRVDQAEKVFMDLQAKGFDASSIASGIERKLPNALRRAASQQQEQAERNFVNAVLRRESGAAISEGEFTNAQIQYFPRAGDTPEVLEQKRQNRLQVMGDLKAQAAPALKKSEQGGGLTAGAPAPGGAPSGGFDLRQFMKPKR
jgi:hypothetical protein